MNTLRCLHEATVTEEEIDHLGHMNVRFYATRAKQATLALFAEHGLDARAREALGVQIAVPDGFTRHYREQLAGARLGVMSGVLSVEGDGLRLYHELVNLDSGERSATFVDDVRLRDRKTREPRPLPEAFVLGAARARVSWPEHGRPRTIDLDQRPVALSLAQARERGIEMRKPRRIEAQQCDGDGFFVASELQELVWGGEPIRRPIGMPLFELEDGRPFGWAVLESRRIALAIPKVGDRIQSFSAQVEIGRKTTVRHQWVFDLDRGHLVCVCSSVDLAFDVGARRGIPIPDEIRSELDSDHHPDLR